MKLIKNLILFCLLAVVQGKRIRIINGDSAEPGDSPFAVSLQHTEDSSHFCGGSILNKNYVITAAHCTRDDSDISIEPDLIQVTVGYDNYKPVAVHKVVSIDAHENYNVNDAAINDIALLKITPPFEFSNLVSPVILPERHLVIPPNQRALISGWGTVDYPTLIIPSRLQTVEVAVVDQEYCQKIYGALDSKTSNFTNIYPVHVCTHEIANIPKGGCKGDSGGPLTINNNTLIGIVSWSHKEPSCGSRWFPDVFTRVSEFIDWINQHTL